MAATGPAAVEAGHGQFVPVWFAVAAGIVIGSAAAAGWLVAARQRGRRGRRGRRERRGRRGRRWTAERRPPGAGPEPVGGAAAAGPGGERQAGGESRRRRRDGAMAMRRERNEDIDGK